jgi:hypothetical protein
MIKAIETSYKGHRFRSRLEARWAVFFDSLGWQWRYEHEGYRIGWHDEDTLAWLPDFEVITPSGQHMYVEVKGDPNFFSDNNMWLDRLDFGGGPPGFSCCADDGDFGPEAKPLLLLGDIPAVSDEAMTLEVTVIVHHKGVGALRTELRPKGLDTACLNLNWWKCVSGGDRLEDFQAEAYPSWGRDMRVKNALIAARSARFEHGQSGAS